MNVEVTRARLSDVETVASILEEAAHWMAAKGVRTWPERFERAPLVEVVERGEAYLAWSGADAVGTVTLQWSDPEFWGEAPDDAGYVHKLAIRRRYAGNCLGLVLLRWAEREAAAAGKRYLRLDCLSENQALRAYYAHAGFRYLGEAASARLKASLFEKSVWG